MKRLIKDINKQVSLETEISEKVKEDIYHYTKYLKPNKVLRLDAIIESTKSKYLQILLKDIVEKLHDLSSDLLKEDNSSKSIDIDTEVKRRVDEIIEININSLPKQEQERIKKISERIEAFRIRT